MGKKLSEMTLEELWELFPIVLAEHDDCWVKWYIDEKRLLKQFLPWETTFYHVGSTAIYDIMAKPIIDMLIVVDCAEKLEPTAEILKQCGYMIMSSSENRISLNKGYTESGFAEKVFHAHIRLKGDKDEVYFRDYLNLYPQIAKEYEALKLRLSKEFEHNRDAYTEAKTEFVTKYTRLAKQLF